MSHIPAELSDYIIDFLHDDRLALKACNLTCGKWRPAARYHLYRRVSLLSLRSCDTFSKLLEDSPFLATFARELNISNTSPDVIHVDNGRAQELHPLWSSLLPALIAVRRLEISFLKIDGMFQTSLLHNLKTVTELSIQYCRFPSFFDLVSAVHSFPSLKTCTLRGLSWNESHAQTTSTGTMGACPRLTKLILGRDLPLEAIVSWFLTQDACQDLIHFSGCCSSAAEAVLLSELLRSASPKLKELEFDWYSSSYSGEFIAHHHLCMK